MEKEELETKFVKFLTRKSKRDGSAYGENYVKDKVARLRKLEKLFPISKLSNITDKNYFDITDEVMKEFKQAIGTTNKHYQYADYMVVVRLLYEMNNSGKQAQRYAFYAGVKNV